MQSQANSLAGKILIQTEKNMVKVSYFKDDVWNKFWTKINELKFKHGTLVERGKDDLEYKVKLDYIIMPYDSRYDEPRKLLYKSAEETETRIVEEKMDEGVVYYCTEASLNCFNEKRSENLR